MSNIIKIVDVYGEDPILRKGDLVRLTSNPHSEDEDSDFADHCLGYCGFVTEVQSRYGEDSEAPGQASLFSICFPFEEGWEELAGVEIYNICRILNKELALSKKEEVHGNE